MGTEKIGELTDRSGRMADGPDGRWVRHPSVWHSKRGIAISRIRRGSIRRQFIGIDFKEPQSAVGDVFGLVEAVAHLHGSDKQRPVDDKVKSPFEGGLKVPRITAVSLLREMVEEISSS